MLDGVSTLLRKGGLVESLNRGAATYQRPTYEFLASLERARKGDERAISFRLMGRSFTMSYTEVANAFGWTVGGENWEAPNDMQANAFWTRLTGVAYQGRGGNKVNLIVHPCFRFAYKLLNDSMFLTGEVGAVALFGIKHFWALCPEGVGTPPWVEIFVTGCIEEQKREKGKISFGGMVTLLANALEVEFTRDCMRIPSGYLYDMHFLRQAQFLEITAGPFPTTGYFIRGRAPLPIPPNPADLFDIPNGVGTEELRNRVLQRNVHIVEDDDGDDEENETEGERGGSSEPWRAYVDERMLQLENTLGARIDNYHNEVRELRNDFQLFRGTMESRWSTEDHRWDAMMQQLRGLQIRDPAEVEALEARRREEWARQSHGNPGAGPGSSGN